MVKITLPVYFANYSREIVEIEEDFPPWEERIKTKNQDKRNLRKRKKAETGFLSQTEIDRELDRLGKIVFLLEKIKKNFGLFFFLWIVTLGEYLCWG